MPTFLDRCKFTVSGTPGTGNVTIGSAVSTFLTPAQAGGVTGDILPITFVDGTAWEESYCYFDAAAGTLARTLLKSSTGSLLSLTSAAVGAVTNFARDAVTKANSLVFIGQQVLGAAASSIDFSNIPSDYEDLVIVFNGRGTDAGADVAIQLQFNGDTGSNYDYEQAFFQNNGTFNQQSSQTSIKAVQVPSAGSTSGFAGTATIEITNYRNTTYYKQVSSLGGENRTGTGPRAMSTWGQWKNTAAINRVNISPGAGNWDVGTVVTLYARAKSNGAGTNDPTLYLIHDQILASDSATYDVTNIPQNYEDLVVIVESRQNTGGAVVEFYIRPNNDTGANYSSYTENRFGTTTNTDKCRFGCSEKSSATASVFAPSEGTIFGYSKTNRYKDILSKGFYPSDSFEDRNSCVWRSNSAITSLRFFPLSNSFVAGTRIRVYGRKPSYAANLAYADAWWFKPPLASAFTLASGDATNLTLSDDPNEGLLIDGGAPVSGDKNRIAHKTLTTKTSDWELVVRLKYIVPSVDYSGVGVVLYDSVSGRATSLTWRGSSPYLNVINWTSLSAFSATLISKTFTTEPPEWFRVRHVGTTYYFDVSVNGKQWVNLGSTGDTTFLTNRADKVGLCVDYNRTTEANNYASCAYFALTGPGV